MNSIAQPIFTAAEIASALGKNPRIVRRWLNCVRTDGVRIVHGNVTSVYKLESLPDRIRERLQAAATVRGFRSAEEMLSTPAKIWQPEFPWNEVHPDQQAEAVKLQRALLPLIQLRNDTSLAVSDFEDKGVQTYAQEFGAAITRERWRYLFDRTLRRDAGTVQFHRPELFLPGNLRRAVANAKAITAGDSDFAALNDLIASFRDPQKPSGEEMDALWMEATEIFGELSANVKPAKVKRGLLDFLWRRVPGIAKSLNALRVNFDRKIKLKLAGDDAALLDGRELRRGEQRAEEIPQADLDRIAWHSARNCGGRTAQAVRELAQLGERSGLSPETLALINNPHASKSHVNRRIFSAVRPDVKLVAPHLLGKKAKDDATPSLRRDKSKLRSMDVLTADDFTMPVYMSVPDGKGWWILTRGQCLLMIDVRSLKIIAWSLQPERNYNSLVIRTLMNRTCRQWGLPRQWYFENGIWRNSHLVKGPPREWSEGKSWGELKPGWTQLGVKFVHAKRARSKPAELVGGLLQNLMERVPGYCGRDERRDCPEATRKNKLAVEFRREEPQGLFLSFDAWHEELGRLIETYNRNSQDGELGGMSPEQAFEAHWPHDNPPARFDASCWHLLAHYVSERKVGVEGITFRIGNQPFIYRDENSSTLRERSVLAWFDPECPDLLGVTDLRGRNPRLIQRSNPVDFCADRDGDSRQNFESELAKVAGHNSYPKARYQVLKATFEPTFRKNYVAPGVATTAQTFQSERTRMQGDRTEKINRASTTTNSARKLGLHPGAVLAGDPGADDGMAMMREAERNQSVKAEKEGQKQ